MQMYLTYRQLKNIAANALVVRTNIEPMSLAVPVRNAIWSVDKDQTVADIDTMDHIVAEAVARQRFSMLLLGLFAGTCTPARLGRNLRGNELFSRATNTRDRHSHRPRGATDDVLQMTVKQGLKLVGAGMIIGLVAAFLLTRVLANFAVWHQSDRSNDFHWHLYGAARSRNPRQLHSGASRDEGRSDNRFTRPVEGFGASV